jgi:hypothetical protein
VYKFNSWVGKSKLKTLYKMLAVINKLGLNLGFTLKTKKSVQRLFKIWVYLKCEILWKWQNPVDFLLLWFSINPSSLLK